MTLRARVGGDEVRRSYSICSAPHEEKLAIAIKRVEGGVFSTWAHRTLVPGASIDVAPPQGRFGTGPAPARGRHVLAFAAGSGITPLLSILKDTLATEPHSTFTLVYSNRATSTTMFREELLDLKDRYLDRFVLLFVMSREQQDVPAFSGRIDGAKCDALFAGWIDATTVDTALVCGPFEMTEAVSAALRAHGLSQERIRTELFAAGARPPRAAATSASESAGVVKAYVVADGRRREFEIARRNETVLQAGLRQGIDLPYSCTGGVCSTCRALLVEGEVDMDVHYALEDYEIKRGYVLTCQSYPVTDTIGIDFDAASQA